MYINLSSPNNALEPKLTLPVNVDTPSVETPVTFKVDPLKLPVISPVTLPSRFPLNVVAVTTPVATIPPAEFIPTPF